MPHSNRILIAAVAFGVAALVMGPGVLFGLNGFALTKVRSAE